MLKDRRKGDGGRRKGSREHANRGKAQRMETNKDKQEQGQQQIKLKRTDE